MKIDARDPTSKLRIIPDNPCLFLLYTDRKILMDLDSFRIRYRMKNVGWCSMFVLFSRLNFKIIHEKGA